MLSTKKTKTVVFIGLQTRQLFKDPQFDLTLSVDEKAAWNAFLNVVAVFLGKETLSNSGSLWRIL
jgi:hypothetical protein